MLAGSPAACLPRSRQQTTTTKESMVSTTASSEEVGLPDGPPAGPPAGAPAPPAFHGPGELAAPKNADVWTGLNYSALNGYRELEMDVYVPVERSAPVA